MKTSVRINILLAQELHAALKYHCRVAGESMQDGVVRILAERLQPTGAVAAPKAPPAPPAPRPPLRPVPDDIERKREENEAKLKAMSSVEKVAHIQKLFEKNMAKGLLTYEEVIEQLENYAIENFIPWGIMFKNRPPAPLQMPRRPGLAPMADTD